MGAAAHAADLDEARADSTARLVRPRLDHRAPLEPGLPAPGPGPQNDPGSLAGPSSESTSTKIHPADEALIKPYTDSLVGSTDRTTRSGHRTALKHFALWLRTSVTGREPECYPDGLATVLAASETDKDRIVKEFLASDPNRHVRARIASAVNGLRSWNVRGVSGIGPSRRPVEIDPADEALIKSCTDSVDNPKTAYNQATALRHFARWLREPLIPGGAGRYPDGLATVLAASETDKDRIVKEFLASNPEPRLLKTIRSAVTALRRAR
jgi:hypothetical protein